MSLAATDPDTLPRARASRPRWFVAVGWALAAALCASGLWAGSVVVALSLLKAEPHLADLKGVATLASVALAIGGALAGLLVGECATFASGRSHRGTDSVALCAFGALAGSIGGGLSIPVMLLCGSWLHPLASSSALWGIIGLFSGFFGSLWAPQPAMKAEAALSTRSGQWLVALGWALAGAVCAGVPWVAILVLAQEYSGLTFSTVGGKPSPVFGCAFLLGWPVGLLAGVMLGLVRGQERRGPSAVLLGVTCAIFGALGGTLILLAVEVCSWLHPIASSSLAAAGAGFLAGLCGYAASRPRTHLPEEDEEPDPPARTKVEWVLREDRRPWRIPRSLLRVTPVLLAAAWAFGGAALLAPDDVAVALLAVGVLGLAVAFVLFRQEERLEALERRLRDGRES